MPFGRVSIPDWFVNWVGCEKALRVRKIMTLHFVVWSELSPCKSSTFLVFSITGAFIRQAPRAGAPISLTLWGLVKELSMSISSAEEVMEWSNLSWICECTVFAIGYQSLSHWLA